MEKKLLYGFGDSLVDGHCVHCGMLDALAEKYGMVYRKYAINGAAVIPCKEDSCEAGLSAGIPVPDVAAQIEAASGEVPDFLYLCPQNAYQGYGRPGDSAQSCKGGL